MLDIENATGLSLHVQDHAAPNGVHGFVNTGPDGIEVHLYDEEDCQAIEATPAVVRFVKCDDCGRESNDWTDPDVCEDCGHDLDFSIGRAQSLRAHSGIRKRTGKADGTLIAATEKVLIEKHGMQRHPDGHLVRYEHHTHDAHRRAATKAQRKSAALTRRTGAAERKRP